MKYAVHAKYIVEAHAFTADPKESQYGEPFRHQVCLMPCKAGGVFIAAHTGHRFVLFHDTKGQVADVDPFTVNPRVLLATHAEKEKLLKECKLPSIRSGWSGDHVWVVVDDMEETVKVISAVGADKALAGDGTVKAMLPDLVSDGVRFPPLNDVVPVQDGDLLAAMPTIDAELVAPFYKSANYLRLFTIQGNARLNWGERVLVKTERDDMFGLLDVVHREQVDSMYPKFWRTRFDEPVAAEPEAEEEAPHPAPGEDALSNHLSDDEAAGDELRVRGSALSIGDTVKDGDRLMVVTALKPVGKKGRIEVTGEFVGAEGEVKTFALGKDQTIVVVKAAPEQIEEEDEPEAEAAEGTEGDMAQVFDGETDTKGEQPTT